ncbi:MAG TPA: protein-methionine-sulfoxide reductase heme-binding subunit MsrQ [Gammaproteobacteria bacterium]
MPRRAVTLLKIATACACTAPAVWTVLRIFEVGGLSLGPNPVEELLHTVGKTSLNLLLVTLAVTPVRRLTGWNRLVTVRRMLGLFAFAYALLHVVVYLTLDRQLDMPTIVEDVVERPYITLGMLAVVLLVPLAVTSTNRMQRRLGRRWVTLHRLVYPIAILAVVHFWWQTKAKLDPEPLVYSAILALLLGARVKWFWQRRRVALRAAAAAEANR